MEWKDACNVFKVDSGDIFINKPVADTVWLDIETIKTEAPDNWPYLNRWRAFMVTFVRYIPSMDQLFLYVISSDDENFLFEILNDILSDVEEIRYGATREFDEMVLKGYFTNARRAHSNVPGNWPRLEVPCRWKNIAKSLYPVVLPERKLDCESRDVPELWKKNLVEVVTRHCIRDSVELIIKDSEFALRPEADVRLRLIFVDPLGRLGPPVEAWDNRIE